MKLVTVEKMKELEKLADSKGYSYQAMMQAAGNGLAEIICQQFNDLKDTYSVMGLVGPGNNGGDTLVALHALQKVGWKTRAYCLFRKETPDPLIEEYVLSGGQVETHDRTIQPVERDQHWIILDGLLGTGIKLPLKPQMEIVLNQIKDQYFSKNNIWIAVDCPSGIDCDTGEIPEAVIPADMTVCMAAVKQGLVQSKALGFVGKLVTVSIGLDEVLPGWNVDLVDVVDERYVSQIMPQRPVDGHKGTFGAVLVVGGMVSYTGAPLLAGKAAYATGAGLVELAVPEGLHSILAGQFPEAIWLLLPQLRGSIAPDAANVIRKNFQKVDSMLVGPGLGLDDAAKRFVNHLFVDTLRKTEQVGFLQSVGNLPDGVPSVFPRLIVDADGLKHLVEIPDWWQVIPPISVLTPHPGEMSLMTGLTVEEIQQDRVRITREYSKKWGQVVILKGAGTVIADPEGSAAIIPVATSSLAHAGTGDVLSGMVASFLGQGMSSYQAAIIAAWVHAQAGLLAAHRRGSPASVLAGDVINSIGQVLGKFWKP